MSVSIAVVCEAPADRDTAGTLADRVILAHTWVTEDILGTQVEYLGLPGTLSATHIEWRHVADLAHERGVTVTGFFGRQPGSHDAHVARLALLMLIRSDPAPAAIFLLRDTDDDPDRVLTEADRNNPLPQLGDVPEHGLIQARKFVQALTDIPILLGVAHPKRECWVLAGFDPADDAERQRLEKAHQSLGYWPNERSENLVAEGRTKGKHNAKVVLEALTEGDHSRELRCLQETSLKTLQGRGERNGLAAFLAELTEKLPPLFGSRARDD